MDTVLINKRGLITPRPLETHTSSCASPELVPDTLARRKYSLHRTHSETRPVTNRDQLQIIFCSPNLGDFVFCPPNVPVRHPPGFVMSRVKTVWLVQ